MLKSRYLLKPVVIALLMLVNSTIGYGQTNQAEPIRFFIKHGIGTTASGTISGLKAQVQFSAAKPEAILIDATTEAKTVNTGLAIRDSKLRSDDYFDVTKYPNLTLKVNGGRLVKPGLIAANIALTIKGITKNITTGISFSSSQPVRLQSTFTISRLDFGVGTSSLLLSDSVRVQLNYLIQ